MKCLIRTCLRENSFLFVIILYQTVMPSCSTPSPGQNAQPPSTLEASHAAAETTAIKEEPLEPASSLPAVQELAVQASDTEDYSLTPPSGTPKADLPASAASESELNLQDNMLLRLKNAGEGDNTYWVRTFNVVVHAAPNEQSPKVRSLHKGDIVNELEKKGHWIKIADKQWVLKSNLTKLK